MIHDDFHTCNELESNYDRCKKDRLAKFRHYKELVKNAIDEGKIFRIITTMDITKIRIELRKRGYIETIPHTWSNKYLQMTNRELLDKAENGNKYEQAFLSKMIEGFMPDYLWVTQPRLYTIHKNVPFLNKIHIDESIDWGIKDGMCKCMNQLKEKGDDDVVNKHFSRTYNFVGCEDVNEFNRDYRLTCAISLIYFITSQANPKDIFSTSCGKVRGNIIDFALHIINSELNSHKNKSTEVDYLDESDLNEARWEQLKFGLNLLLKRKETIKEREEMIIDNHIFRCNFVRSEIEKTWPHRHIDGYHNWWLCKPTYMGEGCGIVITDNDKMILDVVSLKRHTKYVVQKYIERPMLIYNHKFDIRQYFLVQITETHLIVWSHPMCSIKFASQEFTFKNSHESIHVTNTAVQMKYKNRSKDKRLPEDHLWSLYDFMRYLNTIGHPFLWKHTIYPQMKNVIVSIVKGSLNHIEMTPGRFELFGIDWLLTEQHVPILLEINRPPSLEYYSPVSGLVCGMVMEDIIRVTVDNVRFPNASTGFFEQIYSTEVIKKEQKKITNQTFENIFCKELKNKRKSLIDATPDDFISAK